VPRVTSVRAVDGIGLYIVTKYKWQVAETMIMAKTEFLSGFQPLIKRDIGIEDEYKKT
jgi:hypothetical protein